MAVATAKRADAAARAGGWPVLKTYDAHHLNRIALPVGGIGTGTVSLGGRGDLRDWELMSRPAKGFRPGRCFLAVHVRDDAGGAAVTRALEGPLDPSEYEGPDGSHAANAGLPRFRQARFEATYPFGAAILSDADVPVEARVEAFNPLVPGDTDASSWPVAVLRVRLTNATDRRLSGGVCFAVSNYIGSDGTEGKPQQNRNDHRSDDRVTGLYMRSEGVASTASTWGTMAVVTPDTSRDVSHRTAAAAAGWNSDLLDLWDDFSSDGRFDATQDGPPGDSPVGALAVPVELPAGGTDVVTFLLAWHFPNRLSWSPNGKGSWGGSGRCNSGEPVIGNHYTTRFADAWDVATRAAGEMRELEARTIDFADAFCRSDLPDAVKEAALFNLSTLRSQTCFRTPDGYFWGWEGVFERHGSCLGSCTHVWNYEQATAFLFGDLARSMRDVEFGHMTRDDGLMSFRCHLPLEHATTFGLAAADGQMGCLMKLYRDWKLSGDDAWLATLWPRARAAMAFCWVPGGWDADGDGVMEGCQHNTMDVEYYGPNPQMTGWYLGALRACEEMAGTMGDGPFAKTCRELFERGRARMDAELFNGEYYEHHVRPPTDAGAVAAGLRHPSMGARDLTDPDFQLGAGCLVDQLVGQFMAHVSGLGHLHDPGKVRTTLGSIVRHNRRAGMSNHFNHMRSYALGDETALLMASYPHGRRPKRPFPYYNEVMTGFEHTAAVGLMYEGMVNEGVRVVADVRERYDGRRRNPFDEAECGHHYARAMASWAAVLALTGFQYDARSGTFEVRATDRPVEWFWSNGSAWGTVKQRCEGAVKVIEIDVRHGELRLSRVRLGAVGEAGAGEAVLSQPMSLSRDGKARTVRIG